MDDLDDEQLATEDIPVKLVMPDDLDDFTIMATGTDMATLDDDLAKDVTGVDSFVPEEVDFINVDTFCTVLDYSPDSTKKAASKV